MNYSVLFEKTKYYLDVYLSFIPHLILKLFCSLYLNFSFDQLHQRPFCLKHIFGWQVSFVLWLCFMSPLIENYFWLRSLVLYLFSSAKVFESFVAHVLIFRVRDSNHLFICLFLLFSSPNLDFYLKFLYFIVTNPWFYFPLSPSNFAYRYFIDLFVKSSHFDFECLLLFPYSNQVHFLNFLFLCLSLMTKYTVITWVYFLSF